MKRGLKKYGNKQPMKTTSSLTVLLRLNPLCRDKKDDNGGGFGREHQAWAVQELAREAAKERYYHGEMKRVMQEAREAGLLA